MNWLNDYSEVSSKIPGTGEVLKTYDNVPVKFQTILVEGEPPIIYTYAYVPSIFGRELAWYLNGIGDTSVTSGLKCMLMTQARNQVMRAMVDGVCEKVLALRVVRPSKSGKSLLCEVSEWL